MIWNRLSTNAAYLSSLLEVIHHDGWKEEKSHSEALQWSLTDFALFVAEFWQHVGVLMPNSGIVYASASLDDALKHLGLGELVCMSPYKSDQWSLETRHWIRDRFG
ncbi:unnamed protein product [Heligmosomoides polygyrus]|uniref:MEDS domain-containing protein n=1 Tax=Heligmosomoides polygyrus TaxID=6339 RepID=A0A183GGF9_HELPZ|nr:unnamed protein product [Heligmosomoides polygyrus]